MASIHRLILSLLLTGAFTLDAAGGIWTHLTGKRALLAGSHQEFEVTQTSVTAKAQQASTRQITLDLAGERWREKTTSGSGVYVRIVDGQDSMYFEDGGEEYVRTKRKTKDGPALPAVYRANDAG